MYRIISSLLFGAVFSTLFVAIIYNFITKYANPYLTAFSLVFIFGVLTYLNFYLFRVKFFLAFLFTVIPVVLIDASVLVTYPALVPMRFPIATIFPLLGSLIVWTILNKKNVLITALFSGLFIFYYGYFMYSELLYNKMKTDQKDIKYSSEIFSIPLITVNGDTIMLSDTMKAKINIVEMFFVGCIPCEQKAVALKNISNEYDEKNLMVLNICSGAHTSLSSFKKYAMRKGENGFSYFYSPDSTLGKIYSRNLAFPFEQVISDNRELIDKEVGYDPSIERAYIKNKINKIEKYKN